MNEIDVIMNQVHKVIKEQLGADIVKSDFSTPVPIKKNKKYSVYVMIREEDEDN